MLFSTGPVSSPTPGTKYRENKVKYPNITEYFLPSHQTVITLYNPPSRPPLSGLYVLPWLMWYVATNQSNWAGQAGPGRPDKNFFITARWQETICILHWPPIGSPALPHWPLTGRTWSFVSVLTRQTCPDPAWVIGWKLVHWHYWYNIITSQATPTDPPHSTS